MLLLMLLMLMLMLIIIELIKPLHLKTTIQGAPHSFFNLLLITLKKYLSYFKNQFNFVSL